ncbi:hypothetical protein PG993_006059 [Apiospora rasikravindrae]|uniref:2EXR domain-containing protein n=1 Tax=Apiospora rasikravindrae TaxID=990691 RepID=A0ABR1TAJ6_9PEZI
MKTIEKTTKKAKKVFTYFPKLPPEIRAMVWQQFLQREIDYRLILMHDTESCLLPRNYLISPLLSVNVEGRAEALKLYSTKLTVYDMYFKEICPITTKGYLSFSPKGHLYINLDKDILERMFNGGDNALHFRPRRWHFQEKFAVNDRNAHYLGSLAEKLTDEYMPADQLPVFEDKDELEESEMDPYEWLDQFIEGKSESEWDYMDEL